MGLKVIGAGIARTGTFSLKHALEQLGFGKCFHGYDSLEEPAFLESMLAATKEENFDFRRMFRTDVHSVVDHPGYWFYKELFQANPEAQVILSIRNENEWYESFTKAIALPTKREDAYGMLGKHKETWNYLRKTHSFEKNKESMIKEFRRHNEEVQRVIPAENLLVYRVTDGWEPLCKFLGVPVPDESFPKTNSRKYTTARMNKLHGKVENVS